MGLKVNLGIWLNADPEHNRAEIDQAVAAAEEADQET